ncbi:MAG: hypothetical protein L6V81_06810 [Clostridium sp.]|nr:MAG: hypothetical protein L6V81_06810 [Clostridium sp.]
MLKKEVDSNNNLNLYFDFRHSCGVCARMIKTFEIPVSDNENINEIKAYYRVVSTEECDSDIAYKPIMYVYPTKEMDLTIKLKNMISYLHILIQNIMIVGIFMLILMVIFMIIKQIKKLLCIILGSN